ncbi:MAG TPA: response regulator, partial [Burkholderiaceae bacterium]
PLQLPARAKDGRALWLELEVMPAVDADGALTGRIVIAHDCSEQRAVEDALREAHDAAEQANRAKSQFLANMSHEIRTPMNGVLGMAELLLGTRLDDRQRRFAEAVCNSGEALLEIINDILDFSKIEAGKLELESIDFDLRLLVEDAIELVAPRAHQKRLELAYRIAPSTAAAVRGDPTRLRQVLMNILGNAIKFTERGEVVLTVDPLADAAPADAAGAGDAPAAGATRIRFEVRDSGIGMPPEALERVFSTFMQADHSSSRRYGGTGLGLAISRELAELMGGTITATSRVGEGSVFRIDVTLAHGDLASLPQPASAAELAGRRVLVVEDNPTNRSILLSQLACLGIDCASAENGTQALTILRVAARASQPFDAAIIDMKMPVMDGLTLAAEIRSDAQLAPLRLVMLTSLAGCDEARRAHEIGVDLHLAKPVRQQELVNSLATVLAPGRTAQPAADPGLLAGMRVLVAEDNPVNQEVVRVMLADLGCEVRLVADGAAALDLLESEKFEVVLMDCQMPRVDGFEAVRRLRDPGYAQHDLAAVRGIPVIALTANALAGDADRCRSAGFSDYLAKPFRQAQLIELMSRWRPGAAGGRRPAEAVQAAAGARAGRAALDEAVLEQIRSMERRGSAGLLRRLVEVYRASAKKLIADAESGLERDDVAAAGRAMHTLKSSSANLGAADLARRCAEVEAGARSRRLLDVRAQWPGLRAEYERVNEALAALAADEPAAEPCAAAGDGR